MRRLARLLVACLALVAASASAQVTYVGNGPLVASASTCTPTTTGLSWQANDILLVVAESEAETIVLGTANSFAEVGDQSNQSAGSGATNPGSRLAVYWKRAASGSDSMPVFNDSGNHTTCRAYAFRGAVQSGNPWDVVASGNDSAANDTSGTIPGLTTTAAGDLIVLITSSSYNGDSTAECSSWTNNTSGMGTITERTDGTSTQNLGGGHCLATGTYSAAGALGSTTLTLANTTYKGALAIALKALSYEATVTGVAGVGTVGAVSSEGTSPNGEATLTGVAAVESLGALSSGGGGALSGVAGVGTAGVVSSSGGGAANTEPVLDTAISYPVSGGPPADSYSTDALQLTIQTSGAGLIVVAVTGNGDNSSPAPFPLNAPTATGLTFSLIGRSTWTSPQSYPGGATSEIWAAWSSGALSSRTLTVNKASEKFTHMVATVWAYTAATVQDCSSNVAACFGAEGGKTQDASTTVDATLTDVADTSVIVGAFMEGQSGAGLTELGNTNWRATENDGSNGHSLRTGDSTASGASVTVGASTSQSLVATYAVEVIGGGGDPNGSSTLAGVAGVAVPGAVSSTGTDAGISNLSTATATVAPGTVYGSTASLSTVSAIGFVRASSTIFPLSWHTSGRYLLDATGRPWRIQADAWWLASALATPAQIDTYLEDRKAKGFNAFYLMSMVHPTGYAAWAPNAPNNYNGDAPFTGSVFTGTPNEAYWDHVDLIIDKAAAQGIAVVFFVNYLGWNGGTQGWTSEVAALTEAQAQAWGEWIGARYADRPNVIWAAGGDYTPTGTLLERVITITSAIKGEAPDQLWAAEFSNPGSIPSVSSPSITAAADGSGAAMMNSFYGYGPNCYYDTYNTADTAFQVTSPVRPQWMQEGTYEGPSEDNCSRGLSDQVWSTRRGRFWSVLAGSIAGDGFGSHNVWSFTSWPTNLGSSGSVQSGYAFALFSRIPWWTMRPSGTGTDYAGATLISSGGGTCAADSLDCIVSSLSSDSRWLLAYVPGTDGGSATRTFSVQMSAMAGAATAKWWNPTSGAYTTIDRYPNSGTQSFTTPGSNGGGGNDWALVLEVEPQLTAVSAVGAVGSVSTDAVGNLTGVAGVGSVGAMTSGGGAGLSSALGIGAPGALASGGGAALSSVAGVGVPGVVSATASGTASPSGVAGVGSVGAMLSGGGAALSVAVGVGTPGAVAGGGGGALAGVAGVGVVGSMSATGGGAATLAGTAGVGVPGVIGSGGGGAASSVAGVGSVGAMSATGGAASSPSGVAAVGVVNPMIPEGDAAATLAETIATVVPGVLSSAGGAVATLGGVAAVGALGQMSAAGGALATLAGVAATGAVGVVSSVGGSTLTAVAAVATVGELSATGDAAATLTGVVATAAVQALSGAGIDWAHAIRILLTTVRPSPAVTTIRPEPAVRTVRPTATLTTPR